MGKEKKKTAAGSTVTVNPAVVKQYAAQEAMECFGIVGLGAMSLKDGFAKLLKNEKLTKGVDVSVRDGAVVLDFHIIVAYGVNIKTVANNLMESVIYRIENFIGLKVKRVNVFVEGVRVVD